MPFVQLPDFCMHYEHAGAGRNCVLLLHGNFASWRWWIPVLQQSVTDKFHWYALDQRGCGDSESTVDGYTIEQLAADLYDFITILRLPAVHLVGHSLGGAVAQQFTLNHPHLVKTLTLVASAPAEGMAHLRNTRPFSLYRMADSMDFQYLLRSFETNRNLLRRTLIRMMPNVNHQHHRFHSLVDDAVRMPPEAIVGFLRSLTSWNIETQLEQIPIPVLILCGEGDTLVKREALERMVSHLKKGHFFICPQSGHAIQLEQPSIFLNLLLEFITTHHVLNPPSCDPTATPSKKRSWWQALKERAYRLIHSEKN